jgi:glycerate kinase
LGDVALEDIEGRLDHLTPDLDLVILGEEAMEEQTEIGRRVPLNGLGHIPR